MIADDWKVMRADLIKTEESIKNDLNTFGSNTLKVIDDKVSELQNQANRSWALLMETKAGVEVRTPFNKVILMLTVPSRISIKPSC